MLCAPFLTTFVDIPVCFIVYIAGSIGLALQNSYAALFVLRCIQSTGSSATIAMCSAVVADVSTPAERGTYMGAAYAGSLLGPAIGPVIGGVLAEFLGWRSIFWFLTILGGAFLVVFAIFLPETGKQLVCLCNNTTTDHKTARTQVGNGSIPPKGWNMSLLNYLAVRKGRREHHQQQLQAQHEPENLSRKRQKVGFPNPLRSLYILFEKENALLLFYNSFLFAAFYDVGASIPSQFAEIFGYNELQIGLCYIPFGCGSLLAAAVNGQFLDRNFARWCKNLGIKIRKGRDQDLTEFPIEKARLQIAIPASYSTAILVCIWGWILDIEGPLAALLIVLFFTSFSMSVAFNVTTTLLVDFYPKSPATASAANNLVRCLLGAGFTAALIPMIDAMGRGWTFTFLTLFLMATSPMLWLIYFRGMGWRKERIEREESVRKLKEENFSRETGSEEASTPRANANENPPIGGGLPEFAGVAEKEQEQEMGQGTVLQPLSSPMTTEKLQHSRSREDQKVDEQDFSLTRTFSYGSAY